VYNDEIDIEAAEKKSPSAATEFNQYYDFNRLHALCGVADTERIRVGSFEFKRIRRYFCILQTIFRILDNVVTLDGGERERLSLLEEKLDEWTHGIAKIISEAEHLDVSFEDLRQLDGYYSAIMKIRQEAGFGFPLQRFKTAKAKLASAFSD